jgi:CRP-like cAMP-binding protein
MTQEADPQPLSATQELIEMRHRLPVEELLRGYNSLGWTQQEIADKLGVSRLSVVRWFRRYGIEPAHRGRPRGDVA